MSRAAPLPSLLAGLATAFVYLGVAVDAADAIRTRPVRRARTRAAVRVGGAAEFATDDLQATVTLPDNVIEPRTGHATTILRLDTTGGAPAWTRLPTSVFTGSQEDLAHSDTLGVFVASSPWGSLA